jgi:hypothetical protein
MPAFARFEPPFWRFVPKGFYSRVALAIVMAAGIAAWCYWYKPWSAHYLGQPTSYWAERLVESQKGNSISFRTSVRASSRWKWLNDILRYFQSEERAELSIGMMSSDVDFEPVLQELVEYPDKEVRIPAAFYLSQHGTNGFRRSLPTLMETLVTYPESDFRLLNLTDVLGEKSRFYPEETRAAVTDALLPKLLGRLGDLLFNPMYRQTRVTNIVRAVGSKRSDEQGSGTSFDESHCYFFPTPQARPPLVEGSLAKTNGNPTALPQWTPATRARENQAPGSMCDLWLADTPKIANIRLVVAIQTARESVTQGGGIVWRYQNAKNYYAACVNPRDNVLGLYKVANGQCFTIATTGYLPLKPVERHVIAVQHESDYLEFWLDSTFHQTKDMAISEFGKIGCWTEANAPTSLDWLTVTNLDK